MSDLFALVLLGLTGVAIYAAFAHPEQKLFWAIILGACSVGFILWILHSGADKES